MMDLMPTPTWPSTLTVNPCEINLLSAACQALHGRTWEAETTTGAVDLCKQDPSLDKCPLSRKRKKRSRPFSDSRLTTLAYDSLEESYTRIKGSAFSDSRKESLPTRFKQKETGLNSDHTDPKNVRSPVLKFTQKPDVKRILIQSAFHIRAITPNNLKTLLPPLSTTQNRKILTKRTPLWTRYEAANTLNSFLKSAMTEGSEDDNGEEDYPRLSALAVLSTARGTAGDYGARRQRRALEDDSTRKQSRAPDYSRARQRKTPDYDSTRRQKRAPEYDSFEDYDWQQTFGLATVPEPKFQAVLDTYDVVYGLFGTIYTSTLHIVLLFFVFFFFVCVLLLSFSLLLIKR